MVDMAYSRHILTPWFRNHPFIGDSEIQTTDLVVGKTPKDGGDCISESPPKKNALNIVRFRNYSKFCP